MLARNFKSPADLKINDQEFEILVRLLGMLERDELVHIDILNNRGWCPITGEVVQKRDDFPNGFNMETWDCGTAACLGGWMGRLTGAKKPLMDDKPSSKYSNALLPLFYPEEYDGCRGAYKASTAQAAFALRSFLTSGKPRWREAMKRGEIRDYFVPLDKMSKS